MNTKTYQWSRYPRHSKVFVSQAAHILTFVRTLTEMSRDYYAVTGVTPNTLRVGHEAYLVIRNLPGWNPGLEILEGIWAVEYSDALGSFFFMSHSAVGSPLALEGEVVV